MTEYSIGVDLGGTNLRAAAISKDGEMIEKISGSTDLAEGRDAVIADMVDADFAAADPFTVEDRKAVPAWRWFIGQAARLLASIVGQRHIGFAGEAIFRREDG